MEELKEIWKSGDVVWAKIGSGPFFPSLIMPVPGSEIYIKQFGKRLLVHVRLFGDGRASWVMPTSLQRFESVEQYEAWKNKYKGNQTKKRFYNVHQHQLEAWNKGTKEAANALNMETTQQRIDYFNIMYPVTEDLQAVELANMNGVRLGQIRKNPRSGWKTNSRYREMFINFDQIDYNQKLLNEKKKFASQKKSRWEANDVMQLITSQIERKYQYISKQNKLSNSENITEDPDLDLSPLKCPDKQTLKFQTIKRRLEKKNFIFSSSHKLDDACFSCGDKGVLLYCDDNNCLKGYHLGCVSLTKWPTDPWFCPWHYCTECNSTNTVLKCTECINSYCWVHMKDNLFLENDERYTCRKHHTVNHNNACEKPGQKLWKVSLKFPKVGN